MFNIRIDGKAPSIANPITPSISNCMQFSVCQTIHYNPRSNTYDFRSPASTDIFSDKRNYNTALSSGAIDRISDSLSRGSQVVENYFKENKEYYEAMGVGAVGGGSKRSNAWCFWRTCWYGCRCYFSRVSRCSRSWCNVQDI